ncbi:MAG: hypothetical protein ACFE9Q_07655 [Candidatus Hodarchaeota archaeon]
MLERSHSFDIRDKNNDDIQKIVENVLEKKLSLSTTSEKLGRSLLRINYFDSINDDEQRKNNRITVLKEPNNRVYIQIKGKLTDAQVSQLWSEFKKKLNNSTFVHEIKKPKLSKEEIIKEIKRLIELKGYTIKIEEIKRFVDNFIKEYDRLPKKDEFHSIVKGYMIMVNEDYLLNKAELSIKNQTPSESKESVLKTIGDNLSLISQNNSLSVVENADGRRKCPNCGNEGLIHEMDDKSVILMDYPKIYGKKHSCAECGHEWRAH